MIAKAIQGHFLLSHQLDGPLIHLGVMNADAAEDGKGLKERDIRLFEGRSIILQCNYERRNKPQSVKLLKAESFYFAQD